MKQRSPVCPKHTGANSAWCTSNMPGLGPGDRRCKSCRADQFQIAAVAEHTRHPSSKRNDAGGNPAGSTMPGGVKVARRPVKPLVLVRVQVWQPIFRV